MSLELICHLQFFLFFLITIDSILEYSLQYDLTVGLLLFFNYFLRLWEVIIPGVIHEFWFILLFT